MPAISENASDPSEGFPATDATGARTVGPSGRYVLVGLLGRGGMADVHRARDLTLGRDVAVKVLRDRTPDPTDRARFVAEAKTSARLNHPNLVTILDAGVSDEHPFLVLELVLGSTLSEAVRTSGQGLPLERVTAIGAQVAAGLAHCHAAGIVHRDVKPGNILLGEGDRALLTDFGISRMLDGSTVHTQTGFTIGTASYLAPEQVRGDELTPAVDLYALGLVLLEAVTGRREYTGTPVEAALARLHRSPVIPADLPPELSGILAALTSTDPTLRPSAAAVADALSPASSTDSATHLVRVPLLGSAVDITDAPTAAHAPGRLADAAAAATGGTDLRSRPEPVSARRDRRRPPVSALLGWTAAAGAAVALVLTQQGSSPRSPSPATDSSGTTSAPKKPVAASPTATPTAKVTTNVAARTTSARPRSAGTGGAVRSSAPATHTRGRAGVQATGHATKVKQVGARKAAPVKVKPKKVAPTRPTKGKGKGGRTK